ncbi:26S proteasome regulatory subunit N1 [Nematocida sp. AWRm77]|nr:26S proteasome regulatory subunit N1 [Nematocida sp. AWRm77]
MDSKAEEIHIILDNLQNTDPGVTHSALSMLVQKLRSSTSMASTIPKILLYLISHKSILKEILGTLSGENKKTMADILSVVSATSDGIEALMYRLEGGSTSLDIWGHQYVKKLSSDIIKVHKEETDVPKESLQKILQDVLSCLFRFNSEYDALDLLIEVDLLETLPEYVDADNLDRVCAYLYSIIPYLGRDARKKSASALIEIHKQAGQIVEYTSLMVREQRIEELQALMNTEPPAVQLQMAYVLAKHEVRITAPTQKLQDILDGRHMKEINEYVAQRLELGRTEKDTSAGNMGSFPEALAKVSFSNEELPTQENKKSYKISSQSSKGLLYLWNPEKAMEELEEHLFSEDKYLKVSSILALSASTCRVRDEHETVLAVVKESLSTNSTTQKLVLLQSLLLQYAGTGREDVVEVVKPYIHDDQVEVSLFSIYAIGCICAGRGDLDVFTELIQVFIERLSFSPFTKYGMLGLALLFLGQESAVESVLELAESVEKYGMALSILLRSTAYFGTGNSKVLHSLLRDALEESSPASTEEEEGDTGYFEYKHVFAILGVSLLSVGEETLSQMATHILEGATLLDNPRVQMAVPLALSLLHMSTAKVEVIDSLKRCVHNGNSLVIVSSLAALGLVSAGSNNSRVQSAFEQMGAFCGKGASGSTLKIAQGLLRLGKGTMKLSMFSGSVPSPKAISGILGFVFALLDGGTFILDRYYFTLLLIAPGIFPKHVVTVNTEGVPVQTNIRVGTRVDVSGVAGRPKRVSGSQVHETPIILQASEAAEVIGHQRSFHITDEIVVVPEQ